MSASGSAASALERRRDRLACAALALAWLAPLLVIGFHGDFPLNDDWAYAHTARVWLESGRFERLGWTWAPIVSHSLVGAAFLALLGPGFEALRLSGLCMGLLGVMGVWCLCREVGASRGYAWVAAASVGFNPIYLNLSYTFMTDVPFAALVTWSLVLLARGLARGSPAWTGAGLAVAVAATLSRQIGVATGVAWAAARLAAVRRRPPPWALAAGALAVAGAIWAVGTSGAFSAGGGGGDYSSLHFLRDMLRRPGALRDTLRSSLVAVLDLALFAAPGVAALAVAARRRVLVGAAAGLLPALLALRAAGVRMPVGGNVLYDLGVGPATLTGAYDALARAPAGLWWGVTALAVASALAACGLVASALAGRAAALRGRPALVMLAVLPVAVLAPQIASRNFFDRYLLTVLPAALALLIGLCGGARLTRTGGALAALGVAALALWGVLGTRDYLEHHRARWALIGELLERGVPPERLEAGFEFEGWRTRDEHAVTGYLRRRGIYEREFVVSHAARVRRYRPIAQRSFRRWLPPGIETLTAHQRLDSQTRLAPPTTAP
jgi:hypothetical protein